MMSYDEYSTYVVLRTSTGLLVRRQINFLRTSKLFSFYLELHENKFKNLIQTSKFKFSFRGLLAHRIRCLAGTIPLFICSQRLNIIWLSHILTLSVPNDRNIRTASHALNCTDLRFYYTIGS